MNHKIAVYKFGDDAENAQYTCSRKGRSKQEMNSDVQGLGEMLRLEFQEDIKISTGLIAVL